MTLKMNVSKDFLNGMFDGDRASRRELIFARLTKPELERYLRVARDLNISKSELVRRGLASLVKGGD